jgi:hypothetical protein
LPGIFWPSLDGSWWMEYSLCPAGKAIDASQTLQLTSVTHGLVVWCGLMTAPSCFEGGVQIAFWKQNLSGTLFIFLKRCIRCVNSFVCSELVSICKKFPSCSFGLKVCLAAGSVYTFTQQWPISPKSSVGTVVSSLCCEVEASQVVWILSFLQQPRDLFLYTCIFIYSHIYK